MAVTKEIQSKTAEKQREWRDDKVSFELYPEDIVFVLTNAFMLTNFKITFLLIMIIMIIMITAQ